MSPRPTPCSPTPGTPASCSAFDRAVAQAAEHLVVQQTVRGEHGTLMRWRPALEVGNAAAGLLDDRHERRVIPDRKGGLYADLGRPARDEQVAPVVAEAALPRALDHQPDHRLVPGACEQRVEL